MKSILTLLFFFISQSLLAQTNPVLTEIVQRLDSVIHYKEQKKSSYMEWANIWERLKNQHERLDSYSNEFSELVRNGLATEDRQKWIERSLAYGYNTAGVELLSAQKTTVQLSHLLLASNGRINNENFELIKNLIKKEGKSKWVKGIIPKIYRLSNFSDSLSKENRDWIYKLASETFKEVEKKAKKDELTFRLANYLTRINLHKKVKLDAEMAESYWKLNKANTPAIQYKLESAAQNENWDSGLKVIESLPKEAFIAFGNPANEVNFCDPIKNFSLATNFVKTISDPNYIKRAEKSLQIFLLSKKKGGVEITVDDTTFWVQPSISGSDIQDGLKLLRSLNRIHEAVKVATSSIPSLEKMNQLDILAKKYETEFNDEAAFHFTGLFFLHIFKNDYIPFLQLEEIGPSLIDYYFENLPKESVKSDKLLNDVKTRTDLFNGVIEQLGFNYINNGFMEEAETVLETLKKIHSEKYHVLKSRLRSVTHYVLPLTKLTKWIGSEAIVSVNGQVHQTEDGDLFLYMEKNKSYSIELDFGSQKTMQGGFSTDNDANIAKLKSWEISNELQTGLKTETESRVLATSNGYDREYCRQMALQNAAPQLLEFIKEESVTVQDANGISTKKVEGKLKNSSMEESTYQLHKRGDIYEFFAIFSAPFNQE